MICDLYCAPHDIKQTHKPTTSKSALIAEVITSSENQLAGMRFITVIGNTCAAISSLNVTATLPAFTDVIPPTMMALSNVVSAAFNCPASSHSAFFNICGMTVEAIRFPFRSYIPVRGHASACVVVAGAPVQLREV